MCIRYVYFVGSTVLCLCLHCMRGLKKSLTICVVSVYTYCMMYSSGHIRYIDERYLRNHTAMNTVQVPFLGDTPQGDYNRTNTKLQVNN